MDFQELQSKVIENALNYGKNYNITIDEEFAMLKLYEEVGELTQAILIHKKKSRPEKHVDEATSKNKIAEEMADVLGILMVHAQLLEIDLEKSLEKKWINREK